MRKKIVKLLQPHMGAYLICFFAFVAASALAQQYVLAGIQLGIWTLILVLYLVNRANRKKLLKHFVEKSIDVQAGVSGQKPPCPVDRL